MRGRSAILAGILLISTLAAVAPSVSAWEVDATATVSRIIDGDTFDCSPIGTIRLADVDAPEFYEPGYREATDALSDLIAGQTVYLDIDDVYGTDPYDRWVAVVYVRHNTTHLRNVNQALLDTGVVVVADYDNEFDPSTWPAYAFHPIEAPPPSVSASAEPTEGDAPLTVAFTAIASGGIPPYSFLWTFGDGGASSVPNPSHTYVAGGTFTARITVTDAARRAGTASIPVRAIGPLAVTITVTPDQGTAPLTVAFTAFPSGGEPPYSFEWNFGDGNTSSLQSPSHTYASGGSYTATLTVTDGAGSSMTRSAAVTATNPSPPETGVPSAGGNPDSGIWAYLVGIAVLGAALAAIGLRTQRRRKLPPTRLRPPR